MALDLTVIFADVLPLLPLIGFGLFGIIETHQFVDGNKRTGLECMDVFLDYNFKDFKIKDINEAERIVLSIAKGELSKNKARKWIES